MAQFVVVYPVEKLDLDLSKFFDTVDHDVLMHRVAATDQATFLGFTFRGVGIRWTEKAFREFKGPWRLARTLATQTGMTNKWLKAQGLLSV